MKAIELAEKIIELDSFLTRDANQVGILLEAAPKLAKMLLKTIEQRNHYIYESVKNEPGALSNEINDNVALETKICDTELDHIVQDEDCNPCHERCPHRPDGM